MAAEARKSPMRHTLKEVPGTTECPPPFRSGEIFGRGFILFSFRFWGNPAVFLFKIVGRWFLFCGDPDLIHLERAFAN